jgi:LmbE family N-acetylglucosaminyl deacetylase
LGIHKVFFLDYIDGDLDRADPAEAIDRIAAIIREVRPQVAITFGPDGAYGHPDHIAVSQFATAACVFAADSSHRDQQGQAPHRVDKFYYFMNDARLVEDYTAFFGDIQMEIDGISRSFVSWPEWMFTTAIDASAHWRTALDAVNCHKSQLAIYGDLNKLSEEKSIALWAKRTYYRVFSHVNGGREQEADLFEGLT